MPQKIGTALKSLAGWKGLTLGAATVAGLGYHRASQPAYLPPGATSGGDWSFQAYVLNQAIGSAAPDNALLRRITPASPAQRIWQDLKGFGGTGAGQTTMKVSLGVGAVTALMGWGVAGPVGLIAGGAAGFASSYNVGMRLGRRFMSITADITKEVFGFSRQRPSLARNRSGGGVRSWTRPTAGGTRSRGVNRMGADGNLVFALNRLRHKSLL